VGLSLDVSFGVFVEIFGRGLSDGAFYRCTHGEWRLGRALDWEGVDKYRRCCLLSLLAGSWHLRLVEVLGEWGVERRGVCCLDAL